MFRYINFATAKFHFIKICCLPFLLVIIFSILLIMADENAVSANEPVPSERQKTINVRIGIYLLDVGKLDTETGSYAMDFYLSLLSDAANSDAVDFEIMNGYPATCSEQNNLPNNKVYRIEANLVDKLDLRNYPFDSHRLRISIENSKLNSDSLRFVPDQGITGIDPGVIMSGWNLEKDCYAEVDNHYYKVFDEAYSRYVFHIRISRPILVGIMKGLFPAVVILVGGLLSLLMSPDKALQRLGVTTSALIGMVMYHLSLTSSIPPIPYLTFADRFMIINYMTLVTDLFVTVLLMGLSEKQKKYKAKQVQYIAKMVLPYIWVVLQSINIIFIFNDLGVDKFWGYLAISIVIVIGVYILKSIFSKRKGREEFEK